MQCIGCASSRRTGCRNQTVRSRLAGRIPKSDDQQGLRRLGRQQRGDPSVAELEWKVVPLSCPSSTPHPTPHSSAGLLWLHLVERVQFTVSHSLTLSHNRYTGIYRAAGPANIQEHTARHPSCPKVFVVSSPHHLALHTHNDCPCNLQSIKYRPPCSCFFSSARTSSRRILLPPVGSGCPFWTLVGLSSISTLHLKR
jgi:hypothetical protein